MCLADEVYIKDDNLRNEYVLSEEGLMWRGSHSRQKEISWKFGQFQKNMLECSFILLLNIRRLALIHCSDPVKVCRNLSAAVSIYVIKINIMENNILAKQGIIYPLRLLFDAIIIQSTDADSMFLKNNTRYMLIFYDQFIFTFGLKSIGTQIIIFVIISHTIKTLP